MKRLILTLILLLVAETIQAADPNDGFAVWGTSSDAADDFIATRLGIVRNQVEVGGVVRWYTREPWNEDVDAAGAYLCFFPDLFVAVHDPSPRDLFGDVLEKLLAKAYIGIEGMIPTHGHNRSVDLNWLVGTLISLDKDMKTALVVEYALGQAITDQGETEIIRDEKDNVLTIGARIRF